MGQALAAQAHDPHQRAAGAVRGRMPPGDSAGAAQLRRSLEAVEREALEAGDMRAIRLARVAHGLANLAYHWHIRQEQAERRERRLWMAIGVLTGAVVALALTTGA